MAETITRQDDRQALQQTVLSALAAGLARYAQWYSLQQSAEAANVSPDQLFPRPLIEANQAADRDFATLVRATAALDTGNGKLRRWQLQDGPIKWGVEKTSPKLSGLGQVPLLPLATPAAWVAIGGAVLKFASRAALTAFAWHIADLWGGSQKVEDEANKLRATNTATCQQLAQQLIAAGHTDEGAQVLKACAAASAAADAPSRSVWERFKEGVSDFGGALASTAGISGAALLALGLLVMYASGRRPQSPVRFHKPVTFHRPWRRK